MDAVAALDAVADRGKLYESASPALFFAVRVATGQPPTSFDAELQVALEGAWGAVAASEKLEDVTRSIVDTALRALLPPVSVEDALLAPLSCGDPWGPRIRQALRNAGVTDADGSLLTHFAAFKPKKPDAWIKDVAPPLIESHECERVVRTLLEMTPGTPSSIGGLTAQNATILAAASTLAGMASYHWAAHALADVASWGLTWHLGQATSPGPAKAAIVALGLLGTDSALVSLDRLGMRYGNRKAVRKQLDDAIALARESPGTSAGSGRWPTGARSRARCPIAQPDARHRPPRCDPVLRRAAARNSLARREGPRSGGYAAGASRGTRRSDRGGEAAAARAQRCRCRPDRKARDRLGRAAEVERRRLGIDLRRTSGAGSPGRADGLVS